jgi:hypothetical protein
MKTLFFERKYNTNITDFQTTEDVDNFLERKLGRKLRVIHKDTNIL